MKTLVLGLGNELFGDDGVGIHVVRALRKELEGLEEKKPRLSGAVFEECSVSGLALLDVIAGYEALIIVDTIKKSRPKTGKIRILEQKDLRHIPGPSPHYVSVPQCLEIGKKLGLEVPSRIKIVAVEARNMYNLGEGLSEEMARAIPAVIERVKDILNEMK